MYIYLYIENRHSKIFKLQFTLQILKSPCQDKSGMITFRKMNLRNKKHMTLYNWLSINVHSLEQYPQKTSYSIGICSLLLIFPSNGTYHLCISLVWLNASTFLRCQHCSTFPRTAVSLSFLCYLFKIRIRRCVLISVSLAAVCFTHDGPRNMRCCIDFANEYGTWQTTAMKCKPSIKSK